MCQNDIFNKTTDENALIEHFPRGNIQVGASLEQRT